MVEDDYITSLHVSRLWSVLYVPVSKLVKTVNTELNELIKMIEKEDIEDRDYARINIISNQLVMRVRDDIFCNVPSFFQLQIHACGDQKIIPYLSNLHAIYVLEKDVELAEKEFLKYKSKHKTAKRIFEVWDQLQYLPDFLKN